MFSRDRDASYKRAILPDQVRRGTMPPEVLSAREVDRVADYAAGGIADKLLYQLYTPWVYLLRQAGGRDLACARGYR